MNGPQKIRELFASKKTIVAPGAHDMLTAKIIGQLGPLVEGWKPHKEPWEES